jgi:hypothetical protein
MKRIFMVAALVAATTTPAFACHHFRVWRYPWPQRCPVVVDDQKGSAGGIGTAAAPTAPRPAPESSPALAPVQPDPGPPLTKEEEQAVSVEQLRKALEGVHGEPPKSNPAMAGPPSGQKARDKPKVNDVPVNPLD